MDELTQSDDSLIDPGIGYVRERDGLPVEYAGWEPLPWEHGTWVGDLAVHDHLDEHAPVDGFLLGRRPRSMVSRISSWNAAINSSVTSTSVW